MCHMKWEIEHNRPSQGYELADVGLASRAEGSQARLEQMSHLHLDTHVAMLKYKIIVALFHLFLSTQKLCNVCIFYISYMQVTTLGKIKFVINWCQNLLFLSKTENALPIYIAHDGSFFFLLFYIYESYLLKHSILHFCIFW